MRRQPAPESSVALARGAPSVVGDLQRVAQRDARKRMGRRVRDGARHVRDAVEDAVVHTERRVGVRRRMRILEAPALVDGDVDEHRARPHPRDELIAHEGRRLRTGHEHRADDEIRSQTGVLDLVRVAHHRPHPPTGCRVDRPQPCGIEIEDGDVGAHSERDTSRVEPRHAAAEHDDIRGAHPRHAAHEHAAPAVRLHERLRADLRGEAPGDL